MYVYQNFVLNVYSLFRAYAFASYWFGVLSYLPSIYNRKILLILVSILKSQSCDPRLIVIISSIIDWLPNLYGIAFGTNNS